MSSVAWALGGVAVGFVAMQAVIYLGGFDRLFWLWGYEGNFSVAWRRWRQESR